MPIAAAPGRLPGLLAHVRRGVVAGDRVLGHEQPDAEHEPEARPSPENPELLIVSVNTNDGRLVLRGTTASTTTTTPTPIMCHQAEIVLSWASRLTLSRFSARCSAMITV